MGMGGDAPLAQVLTLASQPTLEGAVADSCCSCQFALKITSHNLRFTIYHLPFTIFHLPFGWKHDKEAQAYRANERE